jgi:hypothetical protein
MPLSIITPISYDYKYAFNAIARYYNIADEIFLGLDKDRISWSGHKFDFDTNAVMDFIKKIDIKNKIKLIEDDFHLFPNGKIEDTKPYLSIPFKNETYERNHLSLLCKPGNWVLSMESDEYMLNPLEFKTWLDGVGDDVEFRAKWIFVYKTFGDKYLITTGTPELPDMGTKRRGEFYCARTIYPNGNYIQSPLDILHFSWGRTREELEMKFKNWGHSDSFDTKKYLEMWDGVTLDNYQNYSNLHPLHGPIWPSLTLIDSTKFKETT